MNVNSLGFSGSFLAKNEGDERVSWMTYRAAFLSERSWPPFRIEECCKLMLGVHSLL